LGSEREKRERES
jgi:hypothetical protein